MPSPKRLLLLTDSPQNPFAAHLSLLYPQRVTIWDFTKQEHTLSLLRPFGFVITFVTQRRNLNKLDYSALRAYAERGGIVASCLAEYAYGWNSTHPEGPHLALLKSVVCEGEMPGLRICQRHEITRGFAPGDVIWWFGKVSGATTNDQNPNQFYQRQLLGLEGVPSVAILGVSTLNGGAVLIEERIGQGRIVALDWLSLKEPFYNSYGSTNKYLFLGNLIGQSVRYGKHYPCKWPYDQFCAYMKELAQKYPALTYTEEGLASDGRPVASLSAGNPQKPAFLFFNGIHGWEWEAGYGLLHLMEIFAEAPPENLSLDDFYVKVIPQLNPYGYDHDFRHNARGVDLNRNFPCGWEEYEGGDDVYQPWDYDYKGPYPASEPETQIAIQLMEALKPVCVLDFHTADFIFCKPSRGNQSLMNAIQRDIQRRWKNRYIVQRPYATEYQQANMKRAVTWGDMPHLVCYAGQIGIPAAILIEMSGNRTGPHALVMNTDLTIEICLAAIQQGLRWAQKQEQQ